MRSAEKTRAIVPFVALFAVGCTATHFGSYPDGLGEFPDRAVSATDAVEKVMPYLDETFALRRKDRDQHEWPTSEATVWVTLKGQYYHIAKDNYPYMNQRMYLLHAVKVHSETGEFIPPE